MLLLDCNKENDIDHGISIIKRGGILIFPTDTVYGIGCDPYNEQAVKKIYEIKRRDKIKPLPVLTHNVNLVRKLINLGKSGESLAEAFWPGKLTIIGDLIDDNIPKMITGGKKSLGIRIPNNSCVLKILKGCDFVVGTSANISNKEACTSARQILASGLKEYDALLVSDEELLNKNPIGSTIIDITQSYIEIIREGSIKKKDIYQILSKHK